MPQGQIIPSWMAVNGFAVSLYSWRIQVYWMMSTCSCMLARIFLSRSGSIGIAKRWHAVISPVRVLFWVDINLATACHLHREYQSLGMQLNYSVRIRGTSGIQWQRWCTSDTACFIGVKLILYFLKRRSALGSWRIFSLVPFNFQVVLQFKRSFMKLRNIQVKLSK